MPRFPSSLSAATVALTFLAACRPSISNDYVTLKRDASGRLEITENPLTNTPSFVRTSLSSRATGTRGADGMNVGYGLIRRYADVFGITGRRGDFEFTRDRVDRLGMTHTTLNQMYGGINVYGSEITLHVNRRRTVVAITNSTIPNLRVSSTRARVSADAALDVARGQMRNGTLDSIALVIYPGRNRSSKARLAWQVELRQNDLPERKAFFVDARNGQVIDILDRLYVSRDRKTHSAENGASLPGKLRRGERDDKTGDHDIDNAHEFVGATYDYYFGTHGRDSYDNRGGTITSTVHYRANYPNAFWNGSQMAYGDGFAVKDVVAHETTHAVTEHSAKLEYRWQSGALNESFSDIFGAMVDRGDWLIGEDLPGGPIRNMEDPAQFNHPAHTDDWRGMCADNEGVHINSGIHNKAFVNIADGIGKQKAELIFYRSLNTYLGTQSSFEDSRSGALQAATDLFGEESPEYKGVDEGFAAVGIDGSFNPGGGGCGGGSSASGLIWMVLAFVMGIIGLAGTMRMSTQE